MASSVISDLVEEFFGRFADTLKPSRLHHGQLGLATYQKSAVIWWLAMKS